MNSTATPTSTVEPALYFPDIAVPDGGEVREVARGIYWIRMPLPFALNHINLWLLKDGDDWVQVDTGLVADNVIEYWRTLFQQQLGTGHIKRLIVTHLHPDHVGLAGWIAGEQGATLYMSRTEYLLCRTLLSDSHKDAPPEAIQFYHQAGFDETAIGLYRAHFGGFGKFVGALPDSYERLVDGTELIIDGARWEVIIGQGHSPEHVCLFCAEKQVFISGDQLLPTISSNVSVWPLEPNANPLKDWMDSCRLLHARLPAEVLVLPAHGKPFQGAALRLTQLLAEHERALAALYDFCTTPRRLVDMFPILFRNPVTSKTILFATGEARAHVNYLMAAGQMMGESDAQGVIYYRSLG